MIPTFNEEKKLWKKGYEQVVCFDEAGRGPLAGPVTAGAVAVDARMIKKIPRKVLREIRDSKKLSAKKREEFYGILTDNPAIRWGIGIVSEKIIDRINIFQATKLAMQKAAKNLRFRFKAADNKTDFLILDGKMRLDLKIPQKSIVKGDEKVFSCAAASILAKVTRDRIMGKYHNLYPRYGFDRHKGYPTAHHLKMLKRYGPCKIYRKTFGPVRLALNLPFC